MKERIAVYAGSFDPVTEGHLDIIRRAAQLFDRVVVLIGINPSKRGCFSLQERVDMLRCCCSGLSQVSVDINEGLTVDYAAKIGACALIRGVRSGADLEAEAALADINSSILPVIDTVLLPCRAQYRMVSSTAVREMASHQIMPDGFVPACIRRAVLDHFSRNETEQ